MARKSLQAQQFNELKMRAEADLEFFIRLIAPNRVLGGIHSEIINWWNRSERKTHQLLLLPRDHGKSALLAYRVAWHLTKNPASTFLYVSATSTLAEKQLYFIKNILTSPIYRQFWPEMVNRQESKREKWTNNEIIVDHPYRKDQNVRDPSIFTAGLTTTITGLHFDIAALDDVVVKENAYTLEGRTKVEEYYSLLASIESGDSEEWAVGTRYHPKDLYNTLLGLEEDVYESEDSDGEVIDTSPVYEVFQRQVEDRGDGTGEFIWPRQQRDDGKWFGFSKEILAKKRAKYIDKAQFYAQYYNNPNSPGDEVISPELFQYYDRKFVTNKGGQWFYNGKKLNVIAAIDFAYTLNKKSDFTALVVVGVDEEHNYYVLDIDRIKTEKISEYYEMIIRAYLKWNFRKIIAEASAAQSVIVKEIKDSYLRPNGISLAISEHKPNRHEGTKEERVMAVLEPKYSNMNMWHYQGGYCQSLEEELKMRNPPHDDIKDALHAAVKNATPPSTRSFGNRNKTRLRFNSRFGGVQ